MSSLLRARTWWLLAAAAVLAWGVWAIGCAEEEDDDENEGDEDDDDAAPAQYVGSAVCADCHQEIHDSFLQTGHAFALNAADAAQVADYYPFTAIPGPPPGHDWEDLSYVIGGFAWKALFVNEVGHLVTGDQAQWNFATAQWAAYAPGEEEKPFDCAACHTTGYVDLGHQEGREGVVGKWAFEGVQCEACHGPGSLHADRPYTYEMAVRYEAEACGACHSRNGGRGLAAQDGFLLEYQQYNELLISKHAFFECTNCHNPHRSPVYDAESAVRPHCETCHFEQAENLLPMGGGHQIECRECHMPRVVKSAIGDAAAYEADLRTHLTAINPSADATMFTEDGSQANGYLTVEYVCLRCHTVQTKEWAARNAPLVHEEEETRAPRIPPGHVLTSDCYECHRGQHGEIYDAPFECLTCHQPE